jgi:hypothetical protein
MARITAALARAGNHARNAGTAL